MRCLSFFPVLLVLSAAWMTASCSFIPGEAGGTGGGLGGAGGGPTASTGGSSDSNGKTSPLAEGSGGGRDAGVGGVGGMGQGGANSDGGTGGGGFNPPEQCELDAGVPRTFFMSPDDSNSMGSPALAREYLRASLAPPKALIRPYEFLNYYRVRYDMPAGDQLGIHAHFAPGAAPGTFRLQVGVQSFDVPRPQLALTFAVDTSGSLVGEGIERERAAIRAIGKQLRKDDIVSFVVWSSSDAEILKAHVVTGPDDPALAEAADSLMPGGGSDLHAGITHAYELAVETYADDRLNRVVLISDGGANLGVVDRDKIAQQAKDADSDSKPIYLVGIGVGPAFGYTDTLMDAVTDEGRGAYVYLDSIDEAARVLDDRFDEVMNISAREVQISVTLPSYFEIQTFSGEKYSQNKEEVRPQHIAPGDAIVLDQVLSLKPETEPCNKDVLQVHAEWLDPLPASQMGANFSDLAITLQQIQGEPWQLLKAEAIFYYAKALQTRAASDFVVAQAALEKALADASAQANDPYFDELEEISELLSAFPEGEKQTD